MDDNNAELTAIDHPNAWRAGESDRDSFTVKLEARHLDAFDKALRLLKAYSCRADFGIGLGPVQNNQVKVRWFRLGNIAELIDF